MLAVNRMLVEIGCCNMVELAVARKHFAGARIEEVAGHCIEVADLVDMEQDWQTITLGFSN